tara:strand:- start:816 stop:1904 length:1089 start_codon:yes stop_codon:yes gene_type:complete
MASVHCFGVGLVGSYVAKKLAQAGYHVHAYDPRPDRVLGVSGVSVYNMGKNDNPLDVMIDRVLHGDPSSFDSQESIIVNMLPGEIGHKITEALSNFPWRVVDLSFSEQTPDASHDKAIQSGSSILWDTGIAPGLSNMLMAQAFRTMGRLLNGIVRVGGNPTNPDSGWSYMAPFSPNDVIAEYTRPARVIRGSREAILPALSEIHEIDVPEMGTMEAFLTDGLRSLIHSIPSEELSEYTIRWPGHIQKFVGIRDSGLIDHDELTNEWKYDPSIPEFTWMEVIAEGSEGNTMSWTVNDHGRTDGHSMARCTGLVTIFCIQEWFQNPYLLGPGVHAPESLPSEVIERIISKMISEGVQINGPVVN